MAMGTFLFRCPNTKLHVQGLVDDVADHQEAYAAVECIACSRVHYVNPKTGRVLGESREGKE